MTLRDLYKPSLTLLTDLYQLTMAYGYWHQGRAEEEAVFNLFFRKHPFKGGYTIAVGLAQVCDFLDGLRFDESDVAYLKTLTGNDGKALFSDGFLDYLKNMRFTCDVDAIPEGTVVFPHQPLVRLTGPLLQCQLLETALLDMVNFQTLIATKASRIVQATGGDPVLEFGLRRAHGIDGALTASRAAYIGGCVATSNVLAGKLYGIPVKGTHAHSWVMSFDTEREAFEQYAEALPNNCVFLVDTYDTLEGVRLAIEVGEQLRERGHEMVGIRLDSGDLAYLSIAARKLLDAAGFEKARIVASNDLDERIIESLKAQGAQIAVWGVGTKLATAYDQPALGGVYKLAAIRKEGVWEPKVKLSEQTIKISTPGVLQVKRFSKDGRFMADMIFDETDTLAGTVSIVDQVEPLRQHRMDPSWEEETLLVPVMRKGGCCYEVPDVHAVRDRVAKQLAALHPGVRRFDNPHSYPAGLEKGLYEKKQRLVEAAR